MNPKKVAAALFADPNRPFTVELWDGSQLRSSRAEDARLVLRDEQVVLRLVPPADEDDLADAFARGEIDIVGDMVGCLEAIARWRGPSLGIASLSAWASARLARLARGRRERLVGAKLHGKKRSIERDAGAVRYHYDLPTDFFRMFLDRRMVYSCAIFPKGDETLEEAQKTKLDTICRKLDLRTSDRLLDVGCGWGGLLFHAARKHGAICSGATVSREQVREVRRRANAEGHKVSVYDCDYRELPHGVFDKIASIGMMEHVGTQNLDDYFGELYKRLRPGGLLLNHAIADIREGQPVIPWLGRRGDGFMQRCIFPDSELPPLPRVIAAAERRGFEVRDVESLREHYVETLTHWLVNLESRMREAEALVGVERARTWRLYLASCAVAFRTGRVGVYQTLLAKRDAAGRVDGVPRWRGTWYMSMLRPSNDLLPRAPSLP